MEITLTDQNFEKEVLRAEIPVLVDFWAPWCVDPSTKISLTEREFVSAGRLPAGQKVLSFNGNERRSKVLFSELLDKAGHCRLIRTQAGRQIRVTDDHRFLTRDGWKPAWGLMGGDQVAVFPSIEPLEQCESHKIIIDQREIEKMSLPRMKTKHYINELRDKDLLPLREDNPQLPVLARLVGFCFADGSLYQSGKNNYREVSFWVGERQDAKSLKKELSRLSFSISIQERTSLNEIGGRKFKMHTFRMKCCSTALWLLLKSLGVPEGNKTNSAYTVPGWVLAAPRLIQREFLAGFLGGDGPRVTMRERQRESKKSYNSLSINDLEFYKREDLVATGLVFARELVKMMGKFGVGVAGVFVKKAPYRRRDGTRTAIVHIRFKKGFETGYAFARRIGYAYCAQKTRITNRVGEFIARSLARRAAWADFYRKALNLEQRDRLNPNQIAHKLGISVGAVYGWLRYNRRPTTSKHFEKFPSWLRQAKKNLPEGFFWDVVDKNLATYLPVVQRISVDRPHNFIAESFVVHNCGPCRMIGPVISELAEEFQGKIKVGKLNVDENPIAAQKYGVMSIPTLIFFKGGMIVGQLMGVQPKEILAKKVEELLSPERGF